MTTPIPTTRPFPKTPYHATILSQSFPEALPMAITQERMVSLLSACNYYKTLIDNAVTQTKAINKTSWMSVEEKYETLRALIETMGATSPADMAFGKEKLHFEVYGKANERKRRWAESRKGAPTGHAPTSRGPTLGFKEPQIEELNYGTFASPDEELLAIFNDMAPDVKISYFRDANPHDKRVLTNAHPDLAKLIESELSTQQMEADMQRNPQDFFRAFAPEAQQ